MQNRTVIPITRILVLSVVVMLSSCVKSSRYVWLKYDETYCADAWAYDGNNEILKQHVEDFLKSKDIKVYDSEIFVAMDAEPSTTCTNKTGRQIKCKIKEGSVSDIKSYGFYQ